MKFLIISFLIIALQFSCNSGYTTYYVAKDSSIEIDASEVLYNGPSFPLEDKISDMKIITLETNDYSILSSINQTIVTNNHIYIQDKYAKGNVAIFDINGFFIKRLPFGQGPKEIAYVDKLYYDQNNKILMAFDIESMKIVKYTADGEYIGHSHVSFDFRSDFFMDNDKIVFMSSTFQNPYQQFVVYRSDTLFEVKENWLLGQEKRKSVKPHYFQRMDGFTNIYKENEIYVYDGDSIFRKYVVNNTFQMNLSSNDPIEIAQKASGNDYIFYNYTFETSNYQYLPFWSTGGGEKNVFRNTKNGKMWTQQNNIHSFSNMFYIVNVCAEKLDYFVSLAPSESLSCKDEEKRFSPEDYRWDGFNPNNLISEADMEKLRNVKPDDNPIIVLFKLKDEI